MSVKNVPLDGVQNDVAFVKAIRPFESLMSRGQKLVADSILQGGSEYWEAFLAYYGALGNAAGHDPSLAAELKDLQDQMRDLRKRRPPRGGGTSGGGGSTGGGSSGGAGPTGGGGTPGGGAAT